MKYVIVLVCVLGLVDMFPVLATEVSSDTFIQTYEPERISSTRSKFVSGELKRRMPLENDHEIEVKSKDNISHIQHKTSNSFIIPVVVSEIVNNINRSWVELKKRYTITTQMVATYLHGPAQKTMPQSKKKDIQVRHIPRLPELASVNGMNSRFFNDPYSKTIPTKVKEVYTWDRLWNPAFNPEHYLQCTTYVAMIYNLKGISLRGKVHGDAKEWIHFTDVFNVYENGNTSEIPRSMDIAVWATNGNNHVGVITEVNRDTVTISNANATQLTFTYKVSVSEAGIVTLSGNTNWLPSHWMRLK